MMKIWFSKKKKKLLIIKKLNTRQWNAIAHKKVLN